MPKYHQGKYKPKNPNKYKGDPTTIVYRSGLELTFMRELDHNPKVKTWSSEEVVIPYISPLDNRKHRYFVDFYVKYEDRQGLLKEKLIEIKPNSQMKPPPPKKKGQHNRTYINSVKTWVVNEAKWKYAKATCDKLGWEFVVMGEKELGVNYSKKKRG